MEAVHLPVQRPVRALRPLRALDLDADVGLDRARRRGVRRPDRVQADGGRRPASLRGLDRRGVRGRIRARDPGLLPLRDERAVGPDAGDLLPGRDRLLPQPPPRVGVVARGDRLARPPGGMAVRRPVRDLAVDQGAEDALADRGRRAAERVSVVRRADDHQRPARTSPASSRSSHRANARPARSPAPGTASRRSTTCRSRSRR